MVNIDAAPHMAITVDTIRQARRCSFFRVKRAINSEADIFAMVMVTINSKSAA
jgi:hypothetical protein